MSDFGPPPVIPADLQQYNSYVTDPIWQRKFSTIWATAVGIAILISLPHLIRALRTGRAFTGLFGVSENLGSPRYEVPRSHDTIPKRSTRRLPAIYDVFFAAFGWTLPGLELTFAQLVVIAGYLMSVIVCIVMDSELIDNPNRAGFLAIAQFPVVFLFATKNSVLSLLLGPGNGYEKLNYIHRWAGRGMFIAATIHGSLWIRNHLQYELPILGQQKETSGVAAYGVLCGLVLTSFRPIRRLFYEWFFVIHVLGYVSFFITICYHTIYASPWIFPPLAFYGLDILMRFLRYRIKDASLVPVDNNMTIINVHDCDGGWTAGQHVRLRVFFSGRIIESHPLSIVNAPPSTSCIGSNTLTLAARVRGDWTRALNQYALEEQSRLRSEKIVNPDVPIQVMVDGPYGGCSIDLGSYETVLLVAGGSGATFTLGLLDDIVARCVKLGRRGGEKTRRIEFAWCIRSFGCIDWFSSMLMEIANAVADVESLDLHISIFVTCLCNPDAVPPIPNSDVTIFRPSVTSILHHLVTPPELSSKPLADANEDAARMINVRLNWVGTGGGVGVCASGPETLIREAQNAVAKVSLTRGVELGGVALHTELFAL